MEEVKEYNDNLFDGYYEDIFSRLAIFEDFVNDYTLPNGCSFIPDINELYNIIFKSKDEYTCVTQLLFTASVWPRELFNSFYEDCLSPVFKEAYVNEIHKDPKKVFYELSYYKLNWEHEFYWTYFNPYYHFSKDMVLIGSSESSGIYIPKFKPVQEIQKKKGRPKSVLYELGLKDVLNAKFLEYSEGLITFISSSQDYKKIVPYFCALFDLDMIDKSKFIEDYESKSRVVTTFIQKVFNIDSVLDPNTYMTYRDKHELRKEAVSEIEQQLKFLKKQ